MTSEKSRSLDINIVVQEDSCFDLWHTHVDWNGEGNRSSALREQYLRQLFTLFEQLSLQVKGWKNRTQLWGVVDANDSSQDAVYLHTENLNKDNFPYAFDGVAWGGVPPVWVHPFVSDERHEFGVCYFDGNLRYWIRERLV